MKNELESLVASLPPEERIRLLAKIKSKPPRRKSRRVEFERPVEAVVAFNIPRTCSTWKDALRHLGEVVLNDVDKKPVATIKAQVVDACATLAELCESDAEKQRILGKAMHVVMETDYTRLLSRIATMAI